MLKDPKKRNELKDKSQKFSEYFFMSIDTVL